MLILFTPLNKRIISICAVAVLMAACSSTPTNTNMPYQPNGSKATAQSKDIWQRVRNGYRMPDLYNAEVTKKEAYYAQRAEYMGRMANRSGDFLYLIMTEVERRNMPSEIALLPFIESAFVTTAQSPVKAAGLWQFMPATGRDFALQQNHFADQRNNVIASTNAALTYLQQLHDMFGDWHLALAAYNWGQGNVAKAVRRAKNAGLQGTYNDINMPLETRQYVPKLQAIKNIIANPAQYGITLPDISNATRHEIVVVTRDIDVATAARLSGMTETDFKRINPGFKKSVIAASLGSKLLVPKDRAENIRQAFRNKSEVLASVTTHSSYQTESLADIAKQYNTTDTKLRELNNIPTSHFYVKSGSTLLVPRSSKDKDIPYGALTAGLTTNAGNASLMGGDYIEQPVYVAQQTNEAPFNGNINFPNNSGVSNKSPNTASTNSNDELGFLIKNSNTNQANKNAINDPVRSKDTVVAGKSTSVTPTATIPTPAPLNPILVQTTAAKQTPQTTTIDAKVPATEPTAINLSAPSVDQTTPVVTATPTPQPTTPSIDASKIDLAAPLATAAITAAILAPVMSNTAPTTAPTVNTPTPIVPPVDSVKTGDSTVVETATPATLASINEPAKPVSDNTTSAIAPFTTTIVETPEVIEPLAAVTPAVVTAAVVAPKPVAKKTTQPAKAVVQKAPVTPAKKASATTEVKNTTKTSTTKTNAAKASTTKTNTAKTSTETKAVSKSKEAVKVTSKEKVSTPKTNTTKKPAATAKASTTKPVSKSTAAVKPKTAKPSTAVSKTTKIAKPATNSTNKTVSKTAAVKGKEPTSKPTNPPASKSTESKTKKSTSQKNIKK